MSLELDVMAKKKAPKGPSTLFAVKGSQEWFAWLKRYADFMGVPAMTLIDINLRAGAKRDGFTEAMPKLIGKSD